MGHSPWGRKGADTPEQLSVRAQAGVGITCLSSSRPAFAAGSAEVAAGLLVFFYLVVPDLA